MNSIKLSAMAGVTGFALSFLIALFSRVRLPVLLLRSVLFGAIFFIVSGVSNLLVRRFLSELLSDTPDGPDDGLPASGVDITVDDEGGLLFDDEAGLEEAGLGEMENAAPPAGGSGEDGGTAGGAAGAGSGGYDAPAGDAALHGAGSGWYDALSHGMEKSNSYDYGGGLEQNSAAGYTGVDKRVDRTAQAALSGGSEEGGGGFEESQSRVSMGAERREALTRMTKAFSGKDDAGKIAKTIHNLLSDE
jgi:hypothetical protein